ncbi:MAG TPA: LuxR C-terminal-related transcriptional regulator [Verrucomicrobiae bacterium]|nr:LuxR C-terminal-related transcriptional regulator [Verrucomicrobiae bacterium]
MKSSDVLLSNVHGAMGPLLPALFESPVMGVALLDGQFRFQAINGALAAMNGFPVSSHIGKKLRFVLGSSAATVEGIVRQVLDTGEPIYNLEVKAKLPTRLEVGHWVETYLPIRDVENRVTQVAAFVVELTGFKNFEVSLNHIIGNLLHVSAGLNTELQFFATSGHSSDGSAGLLPRAIELIDDSIGYAKSISGLSRRYISADVPGVQAGVNKADTTIKASGEDWRRMLSAREHEALKLLADCKSNKEIASEMNISVRTAETYRARVMMKLELPSIGHLVRFAVRNNIIKA